MSVRKYEPIWNALKKDGVVSVSVPRPLHPRLIKAVIKEKYNDLGYKLLLGEKAKKAKISYISKGSVIKFQLHHSIGTDDI
jgi:hypothetical protein